jgi:hypothetical protein
MNIVGALTGGNTDGGDWGATWDASVLTFVSLTQDAVWDTESRNVMNVDTGVLDWQFLSTSLGGGAPAPFAVATLVFTAAGSGNTTVVLNDGFPGIGWTLTGGGEEAVTFGTSDVDIGVVPVPAAVWLFGSALGLLGLLRRRIQTA